MEWRSHKLFLHWAIYASSNFLPHSSIQLYTNRQIQACRTFQRLLKCTKTLLSPESLLCCEGSGFAWSLMALERELSMSTLIRHALPCLLTSVGAHLEVQCLLYILIHCLWYILHEKNCGVLIGLALWSGPHGILVLSFPALSFYDLVANDSRAHCRANSWRQVLRERHWQGQDWILFIGFWWKVGIRETSCEAEHGSMVVN